MKFVFTDKKDTIIKDNRLLYIGIIGSRKIENEKLVYQTLKDILKTFNKSRVVLVSGGAKGVDKVAEDLAKDLNLNIYVIKPNYEKFFYKKAPIERNKTIANISDILIAIKDKNSKSTGTLHCLNYFKKNYPDKTYIFKEV